MGYHTDLCNECGSERSYWQCAYCGKKEYIYSKSERGLPSLWFSLSHKNSIKSAILCCKKCVVEYIENMPEDEAR